MIFTCPDCGGHEVQQKTDDVVCNEFFNFGEFSVARSRDNSYEIGPYSRFFCANPLCDFSFPVEVMNYDSLWDYIAKEKKDGA